MSRLPGYTEHSYTPEALLARARLAQQELYTILESADATTTTLRRWFVKWAPDITSAVARRIEEGQTPEEATKAFRKRLAMEVKR